MSDDPEPLQTDEVVRALSENNQCTLVHQETGEQVDIYRDVYDKTEPWHVRCSHYDLLDSTILKRALPLGYRLSAIVNGRYTRYELSKNFLGIRAAAIKGLLLARMLPGVPKDAWLWATVYEPDNRDEPPPQAPTPWPPASGKDK